ncbi:MAG: hypothetical protein B6226_03535 [Candidatus Cloacimonetes bacterium 4572_65]|nr:MAG: hypothetical protein B6226_03535 [Candidatus Cloacimonetes bacterium 4572_65]
MKKILLLVLILGITLVLSSKEPEEWILEAERTINSDVKDAVKIMKQAEKEYPENADVLAYYGSVLSRSAGQASMLKAGMLASKALKFLDKALEIEPNHFKARLNRGILKVNLPLFMGKLDDGIADLEFLIKNTKLSNAPYIVINFYLGMGYEKADEIEKAIASYQYILRYGKQSAQYEYAKQRLKSLTAPTEETTTSSEYEALGDKYASEKNYFKAYQEYKKAAKQDTTSTSLYYKYLNTLNEVSTNGYDDNVYDNVEYMTDIAYDVEHVLNTIVKLEPENDEMRLVKASVLYQLPFFVMSTEVALEEAEWLIKNSKNKTIVKDAREVKLAAEEKLLKKELTDSYVASEDQKEKKRLIKKMQTTKTEREKVTEQATKIVLKLGFGDYIAPQTAVWVEDSAGRYIATVYVSGFSAKVKERQVHLPKWGMKSKYEDSIVKVTGASIDSGTHIMYWDNRNAAGDTLIKGDYYIYTEVSHWPHVDYSIQKIKITLGGKSYRNQIEGDDIITSIAVKY